MSRYNGVVREWGRRLTRVATASRYVVRQFRPSWDPETAMSRNAKAYAYAEQLREYAGSALAGLFESEKLFLKRYLRVGQKLLDVGCGAGREAFGFARRGLQVTGVDVCAELIAHALKMSHSIGLEKVTSFHMGSLTSLDFAPASFDAAYLSSDIFAGIPGQQNRIAALSQCRRLVRPEGVVIFPVHISPPLSLPSRVVVETPRTLLRWLFPRITPEYGDRWVSPPAGQSSHIVFRHLFFSDSEVGLEVERAGLTWIDRISDYFISQVPRKEARRSPEHPTVEVDTNLLARPVGKELVLVQIQGGTAFRLNETARRMWELAADGCTAQQIAEELAAWYPVSREQLAADADALIKELEAYALLPAKFQDPARPKLANHSRRLELE